MSRRKLTDAELKERRERDRQRLEAALSALITSDGWRRWLKFRARFHTYSWRNTVLLAAQCAERGIAATQIAGFRSWLELGRCVRKGERALQVWAPMTVSASDPGDGGEDADSDRRMIFRPVNVFDISQTDPLPGRDPVDVARPQLGRLTGDSHAHLLEPLAGLTRDLGYELRWPETLGGADGICVHGPGTRWIGVLAGFPANRKVATLTHENAHALLGPQADLGRAVEEVVVEAATFVACSAAGLETDVESVPYIAEWASDDPVKAVRAVAARVDDLASRIEAVIVPEAGQGKAPAAAG